MSKLYVFLFFVFYALVVTVGRKGETPNKLDPHSWDKITFKQIKKNLIKDF